MPIELDRKAPPLPAERAPLADWRVVLQDKALRHVELRNSGVVGESLKQSEAELIEASKPLVKLVARRLYSSEKLSPERDLGRFARLEMEGLALPGVLKAISRWDPRHESGASFASFAYPTILGFLRDELRSARRGESVSIDSLATRENSILSLPTLERDDAAFAVESFELSDLMQWAMLTLDPREAYIFRACHLQGLRQRDVAKLIDITESGVSYLLPGIEAKVALALSTFIGEPSQEVQAKLKALRSGGGFFGSKDTRETLEPFDALGKQLVGRHLSASLEQKLAWVNLVANADVTFKSLQTHFVHYCIETGMSKTECARRAGCDIRSIESALRAGAGELSDADRKLYAWAIATDTPPHDLKRMLFAWTLFTCEENGELTAAKLGITSRSVRNWKSKVADYYQQLLDATKGDAA
ncbi:MAG: sigma-70 family RNA polymerase sigma factor [Oligoflexia bacterium]|nr:sigma-70 family RNA polymerase sigma factor [Oligoflexia bacterium]